MRRYILTLMAVALCAASAMAQQPNDREAKARDDWRVSMAQLRLPKATGCFQSTYPARQWNEVGCMTPPAIPMVPRRGPRPFIIGNGNDVSTVAPSGTISTAIGTFESVNVTSEAGQVGGGGGQVANAYSIQLNTSFFSGSPACAGASNPAACRAWEQYIFANNGTSGSTFIQYWLLFYNNPCPGGWNTFASGGNTFCWRNSTAGAAVPNQPITNMPAMSLSGTGTAGADSVTFTTGGTAYAVAGNNFVGVSAGWTTAEFTIVGDGGGGQANFNAGASYTSRTRIFYGGTAPPICSAVGFTGETNNLNFGPGSPAATMPGPALIFNESTGGGAPTNCAAATSIGDTHLTTVKKLFYDFQAAGDFTIAEVAPDFTVQARQVSGAPTWPNATVNKAVGTRMGKTEVALCLAPERLYVDGKLADFPQSNVISLGDGVDITHRNNTYYVTGPTGDSIAATVHGAPGWIDVDVGFGRWPATVKGLLANANDNVNQIASRDGVVLTSAFPFEQLYSHHADSWRVSPRTSLLSVCSAATEIRKPSDTFYTEDLPPAVREQTRAVCVGAGVKEPAFLDACTADVAMTGNNEAAIVFASMAPPAAVGKIAKPGNPVTGPADGSPFGRGHSGRWIWWLLLLILIIAIVIWLLRR